MTSRPLGLKVIFDSSNWTSQRKSICLFLVYGKDKGFEEVGPERQF